ncbi:hypothetical protein M5K25_003018 [Dendrobium thyrsiflorum]|uniref:Expansin-like EG45 domain-containing protein n=1 Tax=Dendrobium thyrsiflorum TaxID=117978 RepID=A0ABD0VQ42_DENTH
MKNHDDRIHTCNMLSCSVVMQAWYLLAEEVLTPEDGNIEANERVFSIVMGPEHSSRGFIITLTRYFPQSTSEAGDGSSTNFAHIGTSVNKELWQDGNICGQIYVVFCYGATNNVICYHDDNRFLEVPVTVVDSCNDCNGSTMLLSEEAFTYIANTTAGSIQIGYVD